MDLTRFDLNLLKSLDILEQERSVQAAAARLHVTPSAISHALARLRRALDDPLFVRAGQRLVATQRCQAVLREIRPFLHTLEVALDPGGGPEQEGFDPQNNRRTIHLVIPGALELSLLPELTACILRQAPDWRLEVRGLQRRSYETDLLSGEVDVVLSVGGHTPEADGLSLATVWQDELVVLQGPAGPLPADRPASLDTVIGLAQVYPVPWPRTQNYLDIRLARAGLQRAIVLSLPGYASLGETLARTRLVATQPDRTALAIQRRHPELQLIRIEPAIRTPLTLETSGRFAASPSGQWFLAQLRNVSASIPGVV